ncbi:hypothetical protein CVS30_17505 [Arthrobacter psychrolactophilus]|uniref:Uncharacterized protein n=1 Tax=Arthrobacter psychrolactophilus TaxID=92442 RepID=A0A2V5JD48_9MICC|nr:DUF6772 family protein [Arthrobacter psychrolactophilus]PYI37047.1 hypothetical protein CVS30_17505 [Arthrobacter psychrolactophilus]
MTRVTFADRQLERFNPLARVITFDDFDKGYNGWLDLSCNYVGENYSTFDTVVDLDAWAPTMLSSASMRFASSHGSMEGTYSLKLTTAPTGGPHTEPPAPGSMGMAIKRLSRFGNPSTIQIETWYAYSPVQDRKGTGEEDIRAFGFFFDVQDAEHRYMPGIRYVNSLGGDLVKRWQYFQVTPGVTQEDWNLGIKDGWNMPGVDNQWYGRRFADGSADGFQWVPNGEQDLLYNESPDKLNWLYLRLTVDVAKREYVEFQSMDRVFDLRGTSPTLAPGYASIENLINPVFFVETDTNRSVNLFLDSVVYSTQ